MTIEASDEQLENGSRPTTPDGDNLQLDFARADSAAFADVALAAGGRVHEDDELGLSMADGLSPCPFGNVAHLMRPIDSREGPLVVAALRDFYGAVAGGPYLLFAPWATEDLSAHGLMLGGHPPMMIRPPAPAPDFATNTDLRIVEVTSPAQLATFEQTLVEAYPTVELAPFGAHPRLFGEALLGSRWRLLLGYDGDIAVATAGAYVTDTLVAIEMVSARAECRGRGFGSAITAVAAALTPGLPAVLVASDAGQGAYRRLGYAPVLRHTVWVGSR